MRNVMSELMKKDWRIKIQEVQEVDLLPLSDDMHPIPNEDDDVCAPPPTRQSVAECGRGDGSAHVKSIIKPHAIQSLAQVHW